MMGLFMVQVLQPAIELAEQGFPVSPVTAHLWEKDLFQVKEAGGPGARALCTEAGNAPQAGQIQRNPDLAATFRAVAEHGAHQGQGIQACWGMLI